MAPASVMTRQSASKPVTPSLRGPVSVPAARSRAGAATAGGSLTDESWAWAEERRLEARYWRAVTLYLAEYQVSYGPRAAGTANGSGLDAEPVYRSPVQASQAVSRFRADAAVASGKALSAQRDALSAFSRINKAQTALLQAPRWRWRTRNRLRAEAARERQHLAAAQHVFGEQSASMDLSLRESRRAHQIAVALRRYDRAHLAAAEAAGRALGWRPGTPVAAPPTRFIAGQDGIEVASQRTGSDRE
jgi:hypothetical protein